jgi:anti-anti-sigma factor
MNRRGHRPPGGSDRATTADVVVTGELTVATSRSLHLRLRQVIQDGGREVRVDLRAVERLDAAGVTVLLVYRRLLPSLGGELVLVGAGAAVRDTLTGMRLGHLLTHRAHQPSLVGWPDVA